MQDDYYARRAKSTESPKKRTGSSWQARLIEIIWKHWTVLWHMRNYDLHGEDERSKAMADKKEVERTLIYIYDLRSQFEPNVQQLLCQDIREHFDKPLWYNQNWLAIHGPLFKASLKRAKEKAIQGVRSIRMYFATV